MSSQYSVRVATGKLDRHPNPYLSCRILGVHSIMTSTCASIGNLFDHVTQEHVAQEPVPQRPFLSLVSLALQQPQNLCWMKFAKIIRSEQSTSIWRVCNANAAPVPDLVLTETGKPQAFTTSASFFAATLAYHNIYEVEDPRMFGRRSRRRPTVVVAAAQK
jgi:hypothetical protein